MTQTTRSLVSVLAFAAVAAGIGGLAFWANKDEAKKTQAKEKSEKLFDFDKAKVRKLRLEKGGQLTAAAEKTGGAWKLTAPVQADGDAAALDAVADQLSTLKQKKELEGKTEPAAFGLDKPKLRVAVTLEDGKEQALELGIDNPFDGTLFVRRQGDATIRMVDGFQKTNFDKSLFELRDKRVARLDDNAEVKRVEVLGVKAPYALAKDGAGWKLEKPAEAADASTAERVVASLKGLRATAVAAEAGKPAQYGLGRPKLTVKIATGTGARTVTVGQASGKTYAMRDDAGTVYEVDGQILKDLEKTRAELVDKQLVHVDREQIRKVALESPAGKLEFERRTDAPADGGTAEESFTVVSPRKAPGKKWKLASALYTITGLRAVEFETQKQSLPFEKTITVFGEGDKVLARLRIGPEKGTRRSVDAGYGKLALVEKAALDELPWKLEDAAEAPPADAGTAPVQASSK